MEHKRFIGTEKLILDGKELPYSMGDFWSAKFSAILLNMNRGSFAEFLVLCAMAENGDQTLWAKTVKAGVEPYDIDGPEITTPHGTRKSRIEVKCTASVQLNTPDEREPISLPPSRLTFSIRPAIDWDADSRESQRNSDLYIFAHYKATRKSDNMLDLSFWDFYVYPTYKIDGNIDTELSEQSTISLRRLQMIGVPCVSFRELYREIVRVCSEISKYHT